ncbi:TfoX/Sxy family protein [Methylibium sp.]|uniref:TfoX/Sxy family protein n=1 Tax=Methylibium sp. TaxID=2067992 RepID=UPI003D0C5486
MAPPHNEFAAHCVELLAPLGAAHARRMFGGHGLYLDGLMIGLIAAEQLYLKTDAQTLPQWQAAGTRPFVYESLRDGVVRTATMSYRTPPDEATESPEALRPWARLALEAALRAQAARTRKRATARAVRPRKNG